MDNAPSSTLFIQLSRLGDCLQSLPLLAAWRQRFSACRVSVLTHGAYACIFGGNPAVDEVLIYTPPLDALKNPGMDPVERLQAVDAWLLSLRRRSFEAVVNLTHDSLSCWVATALAAKHVLGLSVASAGGIQTQDPWSLYLLSLLKYRNLNLFNLVDIYANISGAEAGKHAPNFRIEEESRRQAHEWLTNIGGGDCIIGFQPGANKPERRWPADRFIRVGCELGRSHKARILVFGTQDEEALASSITQEIPGAQSFAGRTNIGQLAALLERCCLLVTNDTGTMHLAAAVGTRVIALFEASAYLRETGPYGIGHWVIQSQDLRDYGEHSREELERLERIPVEEVLEAAKTVLAEISSENSLNRPHSAQSRELESPRNRGSAVACGAAQHFRSTLHDHHLAFYPAHPRPLDPDAFCSHLQRPVWLASLDNRLPGFDGGAAEAMDFLRHFYSAPTGFAPGEAIEELHRVVHELQEPVRRIKRLLHSSLENLRRNPNYIISQKQVAELNELEKRILSFHRQRAVGPFVCYFETALGMVHGNSTRHYLQCYLQPVILLARQLRLFSTLLDRCDSLV